MAAMGFYSFIGLFCSVKPVVMVIISCSQQTDRALYGMKGILCAYTYCVS